MKKILSWGFFVGFLLSLTGCISIALLPNEVKKHNEKLREQLKTFPLDSYCGLYYNSNESNKNVQFSCENGAFEFFIITENELYYTDMITVRIYNVETKEEKIEEDDSSYYEDVYTDLVEIITFVQSYDGNPDKLAGRRGMDKVENEILDEITHYCYDMDWKFSSTAMFDFYVSSTNSMLYYFTLRDVSNDGGFGKPHFDIRFDNNWVRDVRYEYEEYKNYAGPTSSESSGNSV